MGRTYSRFSGPLDYRYHRVISFSLTIPNSTTLNELCQEENALFSIFLFIFPSTFLTQQFQCCLFDLPWGIPHHYHSLSAELNRFIVGHWLVPITETFSGISPSPSWAPVVSVSWLYLSVPYSAGFVNSYFVYSLNFFIASSYDTSRRKTLSALLLAKALTADCIS